MGKPFQCKANWPSAVIEQIRVRHCILILVSPNVQPRCWGHEEVQNFRSSFYVNQQALTGSVTTPQVFDPGNRGDSRDGSKYRNGEL